MSDWHLQARVQAFMFEYAACLDEERFDDWVALFDTDTCTYEVLSRENRDLGLPAPIMGCYSHGMVCDRVAMLVKGVLTYRHNHLLRQVGNVRVSATPEGAAGARNSRAIPSFETFDSRLTFRETVGRVFGVSGARFARF